MNPEMKYNDEKNVIGNNISLLNDDELVLSECKTPQSRAAFEMSESLRKKLKRSGRYYSSPVMSRCPSNSSIESSCPSDKTPLNPRKFSVKHNSKLASMMNSQLSQMANKEVDENSETATCTPTSSEEQPLSQCQKTSEPRSELKKQKAKLQSSIAKKEEVVHKLHLVRTHRQKNDLATLKSLTNKWRNVVQQALNELWQLSREPKPTLTEVVEHFQLDHRMIGYKADTESFE